jgi:hypothetical protein
MIKMNNSIAKNGLISLSDSSFVIKLFVLPDILLNIFIIEFVTVLDGPNNSCASDDTSLLFIF